ncbi:MAG: ABC transporter ATP-binding protein [Micropepsaceae bacterium]
MTALKLDHVAVALGARTVLTDVNLSFAPGELVGVMGPNGSGKSTLMRAAGGLIARAAGEITVLDKPLDQWRGNELGRAVAYLPQGGQAHWPLSVRALVTLGRLPHAHRFVRTSSQDIVAVERAMTACDVIHLADRPVTALSGGERARALLARALAGEAKILLADEPFAQLDPNHQLHAMEVLQSSAQSGALVIVVLHDLSIAARHCTRVILMSEGCIAADGNPSDVLSSENLRKTFGVDAFIGEHGGAPVILPLRRRA